MNNSQDIRTNMVTYEVNIDFDDASSSWKQNKKSIGNGQYKYICPKDKKDGREDNVFFSGKFSLKKSKLSSVVRSYNNESNDITFL